MCATNRERGKCWASTCAVEGDRARLIEVPVKFNFFILKYLHRFKIHINICF